MVVLGKLIAFVAVMVLLLMAACGGDAGTADRGGNGDRSNAGQGADSGDAECGCSERENAQDEAGEIWYDSESNLTWQINPAVNELSWHDAIDYCTELGEGWRLPTLNDLRSLIRGCPRTETGGACRITDICLSVSSCASSEDCGGCNAHEGPDYGCYWPSEMKGTCGWYWSSSPTEDTADSMWTIDFYSARLVDGTHTWGAVPVRCVRREDEGASQNDAASGD